MRSQYFYICSSESDKISSLLVFLCRRKIYTSSHLLQYQVVYFFKSRWKFAHQVYYIVYCIVHICWSSFLLWNQVSYICMEIIQFFPCLHNFFEGIKCSVALLSCVADMSGPCTVRPIQFFNFLEKWNKQILLNYTVCVHFQLTKKMLN